MVLPARRFRMDMLETINQIDREFIYDSTATKCVHDLITNISNLLIPQSSPFAEITVRDSFKNRTSLKSSMGAALEDANLKLHKFFLQSKFYMKVMEVLQDAIVGGTYCLLIHDIPDEPIRFIPVPVDELYILQDKTKSQVDCVFRAHIMRGRQLLQRKDWNTPDKLKRDITNNPGMTVNVVERVIPNENDKYNYVVWYGGDCEILFQAEIALNPYIVARWGRITGQAWGTSPARDALPDIRSINQIQKDALQFSEWAANGFWQTNADSFGEVDAITQTMKPGCIIPRHGDHKIEPVEFPGQFQLNFQMIDRLTLRIKAHMLASQMPQDGVQYMKEGVAQILKAQFEAQIGEPALRIEKELLLPVAQQVAYRLFRRGELRVVDLSRLKSLGISRQVQSLSNLFEVDTNAALSRVLKQQEAQQNLQGLQYAMQSFGPQEVAARVDTGKMLADILPALGVAARFIRSDDQATQIMQQEQQSQAAMASAAMAQGGQAPSGSRNSTNLSLQSLQGVMQLLQGRGGAPSQ